MFKVLRNILMVLFAITLTGCFPIDVSHNPKYQLGYKFGEIYCSKKPLILEKFYKEILIEDPDRFSKEAVSRSISGQSSRISKIATLETGTKFQIKRIIKDWDSLNGDTLETEGEIITGKYKGYHVGMIFVSNRSDRLNRDDVTFQAAKPDLLEFCNE